MNTKNARLLALLVCGGLLMGASGCAKMAGIEEDPTDTAIRTGKKAKAMQEERYKRVDDATAVLDGK